MRLLPFLLTVILLTGSLSSSYSSQAHKINPRILKENCKSLVIKCFCDINQKDILVNWERCYYDDYDSLTFDRKGNMLSSCKFDFDWKTHNTIFEYDCLSNRISTKSYDSEGTLLNHTRENFNYDNKGHIIEATSTSTGDAVVNNYMVIRAKYKYDENGNQTECSLIDAKGAISSKDVYTFNEKNKVVEETHFTSAGKVWHRDIYDYDNQGNRILWEYYNSEDKLISRTRQKYDHSNNLIDNEVYELRDGQLQFSFRSHLKYDENNNQTQVNTYNEKDDLLSEVSFDYKYDSQGNWVECAELHKMEQVKRIVRKIEYF